MFEGQPDVGKLCLRATCVLSEVARGCAEEDEVTRNYVYNLSQYLTGEGTRAREEGGPVTASRTEGFAVVNPAARSDWAADTRRSAKNSSWSFILAEAVDACKVGLSCSLWVGAFSWS